MDIALLILLHQRGDADCFLGTFRDVLTVFFFPKYEAGPSTDGKVTELLNGCPKADVQPLLYKDEKCAVFWTRSPECAWHLLVVPLEHIQTVDDMIDQVIAAFPASTWHCLPAGHRLFPRFPRWTFA